MHMKFREQLSVEGQMLVAEAGACMLLFCAAAGWLADEEQLCGLTMRMYICSNANGARCERIRRGKNGRGQARVAESSRGKKDEWEVSERRRRMEEGR